MNRDPFYNQIIERLNGRIDPELFEQCAADLLRSIFPGLTPMRGGSDAGMDGAVSDGRGEPFSLITTIRRDVIGNFTKNLETYLRTGGARRQVAVATSRSLTPMKKNNLLNRARDYGFELISIQDQAAFADKLYRDPPWCLELLNLHSTPSSLSRIPLRAGFFFDAPLVGRESSLNWLRQTPADSLLIGQPGSGKTFLLRTIAQENRGLFLVTSDRGDIAGGIRSQQPTAIFVDDAGAKHDLLDSLMQMRQEMGATFSIVASGWPGEEIALGQRLNVPDHRVLRLEPLTRGEIKEVVYSVGVKKPNQVVGEIIGQAEGRPGLAVTLALLWLQGDHEGVFSGDILYNSMLHFAEQFVSREAASVLAIMALSGDSGLSLSAVAELTDSREIEVHRLLNQLTASGIVMDVGEEMLTVRPPALRYVLVRNVFFEGVTLSIDRFLNRMPRRSEAALVLIGARERGAAVSDELLRPLVIESSFAKVWEAYAGLGPEEAEWVLRNYPDMLSVVAEPGLFNSPQTFLPALLTAAVNDHRPLNQHPDHPLRHIGFWIESALPGRGRAFHLRSLLLDAVEIWLSDNDNWRVGGHVLKLLLSPNFEYRSADPGHGHYVEFTSGILSSYELSQVRTLWPRVFNLISGMQINDWSIIHQMIETWIYGKRAKFDLPDEVRNIMDGFAVQMARDVTSLARQNPATLRWARRVVQGLGADIAVELDPDFEILYPAPQREKNLRESQEGQRAAVYALAERWSGKAADQIARKIAQIETEANSAELRWPRWTPLLCGAIADRVTSRVLWARHFIRTNLSSDLVLPFIRLAAETDEEDWESLALECLNLPEMRNGIIFLILNLANPPDELFERLLQHLDNSAEYVQWACSDGRIPERNLRHLLKHPNPAIASAAAEGEWQAEPRGVVRESFRGDWEEVVVHSSSDYWLTEVFRTIPRLAYRWLQNHLAGEGFHICDAHEEVIQSAVGVLTPDERRDLLEQIPDHYGFKMLVVNLVSGYPDLYHALLKNDRLQRYHSAPLAGKPEGDWFDRAILAYDAGYSPEDIARSAVYEGFGGISCAGPRSAHWSKWLERFERLLSHPDQRIRDVGEAGRAWAITERDNAKRQERREAVYGMRR